MREGNVRAIAVCLIYKDDQIFVAEGFDKVKGSHFYRPLGGEVEFGEYGHETVAREFREEVKATLKDIRYLFTVESIFSLEGKRGHEIVQVYEASFADASLYEQPQVEGIDDGNLIFTARWMPLDAFRQNSQVRLVPEALQEKLL